MSQVADFDILKEIPGYKAILKSVLKTQIQLLIEQLSDQTGEESIILTASINEGTLSHLGSNMGKGFFEGRDEIKSQFLGYCLKNFQRKDGSQARTAYEEDTPPDGFQQGPPKRQKVHPVSVTRVEEDYGNSSFIPDPGSQDSFTPSVDRNKALTLRATSQPSAQNMKRPSSSSAHGSPVIPSTHLGGNGVKIEDNSDNQDSDKTVDSPHEPISVQPFEPAVLPSSVHLSHTQTQQSYTAITDNDAEPKDDSNLSAMGQSGDSSEHSNVKMEPVTENELELEITGVEMAGGPTSFQGDWGQDISGGMGYDQSDSRDDSLDQSGNQYKKMPVLTKEVTNDSEDDDNKSISSDSSYDFEENEMYMEMKDDENSQDDNLESHNDILLSTHQKDEDFYHLYSTGKLLAASTSPNTDHMVASPTAILETETVDAQQKITSDSDHKAKNQTQAEKKQNLLACKDLRSMKKMKQNPSMVHKLKRKQKNQDDLKCEYCGKRWLCRSHLLEHLPVHTGEKNFSCSRCGKKFMWRSTFKNHKCTNSNEKAKGTLMTEIKKKENLSTAHLKGCTCNTCGKHFSTLSSLKKHALTHKKSIDLKSQGSVCKLCRKRFTSRYHLFKHALTHSKSKLYTCKQCQKKFVRKANLARHQKTACFVRKSKTNTPALYPEKEASQPSSMRQTGKKRNTCKSSKYGNVLSGVQPINNTRNPKTSLKRTVADLTCSYCNKVWPDITKLHDHLSVHTGFKNFRCSKCRLEFKWRNAAKSHVKKCGGEVIRTVNKFKSKGFKTKRQNKTVSKFCHKTKKNSVELKTHLHLHTKEKKQPHLLTHTNIKPLSCMWCLMRFKSSDALAKHQKLYCPERKLYNSNQVKKIIIEKADTGLGSSNELNAKTEDMVYFSCSCGKNFKFRKSLQVHKTKCQGKSSENSDSKPTQGSKSESCGSGNKDGHVMPLNRREVEESSDNSSIIKDLGNVVLKKDINRKQIENTKEQRKHPCPLCEKLFTRKDTVEKHLKIHFGVSHFKCKYCNMNFKSFHTLNNHKVEAHSNVVDNRPDET